MEKLQDEKKKQQEHVEKVMARLNKVSKSANKYRAVFLYNILKSNNCKNA